MESKGTNFVASRIASGQKVVGDYTYYLLLEVGLRPQHMIMRIKSDDSEIKFFAIPTGADYTTLWTAASSQTYVYANEL